MIIIYRIEHIERKTGPYRDKEPLSDKLCNKHNGSSMHPVSQRDCGFLEKGCCGFTSIADLKQWFRGFVAPLHRENYIIRVFEVDDNNVKFGEYQCVFIRPETETKIISLNKI